MNNLFNKIFHASTKQIPQKIKDSLILQFPEALNVEWEAKGKFYEAVFYVNDIEFIAKISEDSTIVEFKQNLKLNELPDFISAQCLKLGEIMNAIVIKRDKAVLYEVIVRDKNLDRSVLLLDERGKLLKNELL